MTRQELVAVTAPLSSCPPADRLRRLLAEALPAPDQAERTAHVGECSAGQRLLDQLAGADPDLRAHQGSVLGVAFAPDGRTLATIREDRLGKLWGVSGLAP